MFGSLKKHKRKGEVFHLHAMKAHERVEIQRRSFLTSEFGWD